MYWLWKVLAFKVLGLIPAGESIHYLLQRRITRSLIVTDVMVLQRIQMGMEYLDFLEEVLNIRDFNKIICIDIGAGWFPIMPLLFYSIGSERQLLCDIRCNMRAEIVSDGITIFRQVVSRERSLEARCKRLPLLMDARDTLERYLKRLGIDYIAPYNHNDLLKDKGFKLITCTQVLEYISKDHLRSLFQTIASTLKGGGIFVATVQLHEPYAAFKKTLSPYNKWRYSDLVWEKLINSKMMYFNRLMPSEYRQLLREAGLEVIKFHLSEPTLSDLQALRHITVHKKFRNVPEIELAARELFLAVKAEGTDISFF